MKIKIFISLNQRYLVKLTIRKLYIKFSSKNLDINFFFLILMLEFSFVKVLFTLFEN